MLEQILIQFEPDDITLPIICPDGIQLDSSIHVLTMVADILKDTSLSDAWTDVIPRFMKFGLLARMASHVKFI